MESETYTGLTAGTFKGRYYGHNRSFNIREAKQTTLSRHCWNLKDKKIPFDRKWTILTHAKPYNPVTKVCRLCMKEVFYILYKPETASLNKKNEVFGWCKHRQHWTPVLQRSFKDLRSFEDFCPKIHLQFIFRCQRIFEASKFLGRRL